MKLKLLTIKTLLLLSSVWSLYIFVHKIVYVPSPPPYELEIANMAGYYAGNSPGLLSGILSGFITPVSMIFLGLLYLANGGQMPGDVSALMSLPFLWFGLKGDPGVHFGLTYDIGFVTGLLLVIPAILAIGRGVEDSA